MKVLYLTDDRSDYRMGYYYVDWIRSFQQHHEVILWGPGFPPQNADIVNQIDLIVIGHGAFDVLKDGSYDFKLRRPWQLGRRTTGWWQFDLRKLQIPKVFLSKNDYKLIAEKVNLVRNEKIDLLVTHCKQALKQFRMAGIQAEWIPFGVDTGRFRNLGLKRDVDIGFRGNMLQEWLGDTRVRLLQNCRENLAHLKLDLQASSQAENFLFGNAYVEWLNRCHLILNTASALDTVGPKWWEEMACGCVPLAPVGEYEGLLEPDVHYLSLEPDFSNLKSQVDRFYTDKAFRERLSAGIRQMAENADMEKRYQQLWNLLGSEVLK